MQLSCAGNCVCFQLGTQIFGAIWWRDYISSDSRGERCCTKKANVAYVQLDSKYADLLSALVCPTDATAATCHAAVSKRRGRYGLPNWYVSVSERVLSTPRPLACRWHSGRLAILDLLLHSNGWHNKGERIGWVFGSRNFEFCITAFDIKVNRVLI